MDYVYDQNLQNPELQNPNDKHLVLVMGPPSVFTLFRSLYSHNYRFLNAGEHPNLSLSRFISMATQPHGGPSSIRALLLRGGVRVTTETLDNLPSLGLILTTSIGVDHIDLPECRRRGIKVASTGTVTSKDVAEVAVGLLIDVLRKISAGDRYTRRHNPNQTWDFPLGSKLGGKRVGIVGLGSIGLEVAKRLEAFNCIISYNSRNQKPFVSYSFYSNIVELAATSDALIICCELNEETHHMVDKEVMLALGEEGVIVNISRGAVIDEKELVRFLSEGKIAGAGLDVFEHEPHVPKELLGLEDVVLSSHVSFATAESFKDICEIIAGNFDAFFSDKPLITPVSVTL